MSNKLNGKADTRACVSAKCTRRLLVAEWHQQEQLSDLLWLITFPGAGISSEENMMSTTYYWDHGLCARTKRSSTVIHRTSRNAQNFEKETS